MKAHFKTINLARDFKVCQHLRAISYQASFGTLDGFEQDYGESYRTRLQQKIDQLPQGCCHLWLGSEIVGQIEAKWVADPDVGYINLVVLKPEYQRQGYGTLMLGYLSNAFSKAGKTRMQLSISPSNTQAMSFYLKHGWIDTGPRADAPHMRLMSKALP